MFGLWGNDPLKKAIKLARKANKSGHHEQALRQLRTLLPSKELSNHRADFLCFLKALKPVGAAFAGEEFAEKVATAISKPDDSEVLYKLGYDLVEYGLHAFATLPLYRLHHLAPPLPLFVSELAAALEGLMMSEEIVTLITDAGPEIIEDPVCFYLLTFHHVMCGQLEAARTNLPRLCELMQDEEEVFMFKRVSNMITRADQVKPVTGLSDQDLVGWHYVKTGGILTYLSPFGFDEGMAGRFAFTQDSYSRCRFGIVRLMELLQSWEVMPPRVFFGRDRSSKILGAAVAAMLAVPAEPLVQASGPGLIVLYDLGQLEGDDWDRVTLHQPGRPLFVHALNWVEPPAISPDILTLLYQVNTPPWAPQMNLQEGLDPEWTPEDTRPIPEIVADILNAKPMETCELERTWPLAPLAIATKTGASALLEEGYRERYWPGGPVKSSMFL